jgi:hypothetical protein
MTGARHAVACPIGAGIVAHPAAGHNSNMPAPVVDPCRRHWACSWESCGSAGFPFGSAAAGDGHWWALLVSRHCCRRRHRSRCQRLARARSGKPSNAVSGRKTCRGGALSIAKKSYLDKVLSFGLCHQRLQFGRRECVNKTSFGNHKQ